MEKSAKLHYAKERHRLLKIRSALPAVFLCVLLPLVAQHGEGQKQQYDPVLHIPATTCTAGDSLTFVIQVPYIEPAKVSYVIPPLPQKVRLAYAKKDLAVHFSGNFTNIELTLTFTEAGTVLLPPLEVTAEGVKHRVIFPEMTVLPQLSTILPEVFWQSDITGAVHAGDMISLTLAVKNALSVTAFSCEAQEDSLLEQKTPVRSETETRQKIPDAGITVAHFTWVPLQAGTSFLPSAKLTVRSLDGREQVIYTEPQSIRVLPAEPRGTAAPAAPSASMQSAFTESSRPKTQTALLPDGGRQIAAQLVALRQKERNALLPFSAAAERKAAEEQAGIQAAESELPAAWIIPLYAAALLCVLVTVILSIIKRRFVFTIFAPLIVFLFLAAILHFVSTKPCAVTLEVAVKTVPEVSATTAANLKAGTHVHILSSADGWLHIRYNENRSGWLPANSVIYINGVQP